MKKYIPDRKVWAGGMSALVAFAVAQLIPGLDQEVVAGLVVAAWAGASYLIPPSVADIVTRVDDNIIKLAGGKRVEPDKGMTDPPLHP